MTAGACPLSQERGQHAAEPRAERLHGIGVILAHDADGGGEIDRADGFGEGISCFDEVFVSHRGAFVRQTLAQAQKAAFRSSCSLIAQLAIANACRVHALCELASHAVDIESLKSEQVLIVHGDLLAPRPPKGGGRHER